MENNYKLMCSGANINNFINLCKNENIEMFNLEKVENKITFEVTPADYNLIKNIGCRGCIVQVISLGGIKNIRKKSIFRLGLVVGFLLSVLLILFFNNRVMYININGLECVSEEEVLKTLKESGVKYMSRLTADTAFIEDILTENYNFSMVSAIKKGNAVIINIKEELKNIEDEYVEITSDYNMIIKSIEVFAGTPNVDIGDIVRKNDVLVYPYILQDDKKVFVKPSVKIVADVFYVDKFDFKNTEIKLVRTGAYIIVDEKTYIGKYNIMNESVNADFENFELEQRNLNISSYLLPIKIDRQIAYELDTIEVSHNFEDEKDDILTLLKDNVYNIRDNNAGVIEEDYIVTKIDNGYVVTYYLKCSLQLEYN